MSALNSCDQLLQRVGVELGVERDAARRASSPASAISNGSSSVLRLGLEAEHDVAVHLHEAAVGVVGEARVAGLADQALDGLVVEAEVQDRVHHARHRRAGARADRDQERMLGIAESLADRLLDARQRVGDLRLQRGGIRAARGVVVGADLGRDREAGRHRQPEPRHLGEVRALAAEQLLHVGAPVGLAAAEGVDVATGRLGGRSAARRARARAGLRSCHRSSSPRRKGCEASGGR